MPGPEILAFVNAARFFTKQRTVATGATWFSCTMTVSPLESARG